MQLSRSKEKALFIDRDGVINAAVYYADFGEHESPRTAADLALLPGVIKALQVAQAAHWKLFLISNQPSYAKGKTSLENLKGVQAALLQQLIENQLFFEEFYYSYTHPNGIVPEYTGESDYRKPNPGFLLQAQAEHSIDLKQSWMIGDRDTDIQCGQAVGCKTAQILYPLSADKQGQSQPDLRCQNLPDFIQQLIHITEG